MKNIKTLTIGIVIGAVATLSISALAEYIVNPNPYPIKVNGQEVQIEGYNINDNTYFKLRDVGDKIGFSVDFQDGAIVVSTDEFQTEPISAPVNESAASTQATPNPKVDEGRIEYAVSHQWEFTSDGLPIEVLEDGGKYVYQRDIKDAYNFNGSGYKFGVGNIMDNNYNVVLDNIPLAPDNIETGIVYIELSYYESTLIPWLNEHCK